MDRRSRRLLVVSHPAVITANQLPYVELRHRGWQVDLVVPATWSHSYRPERFAAQVHPDLGTSVHPLPVMGQGKPLRHLYLARPTALLRRVRPDIVFLEQEPFAVAAVQWSQASRRRGIPFGVQADENLDRSFPPPVVAWRGWVLRHAAFVAARSERAGQLVRDWGATGDVELVPHHIVDWGRPAAPTTTGQAGFRVGFAGRLVPEKGLDTLVGAVRQLEGPVDLVVAGDGPERPWLESQDFAGHRLTLLTGLSHEEMAAAYARMDVLVLPSRSTPAWTEQFGRVLVEALCCGVPVVGSSSGEIPWVIETTGGGVVFPEGDVSALAAALRGLRDRPEQRRALAAHGERKARAMFTPTAVADQLERLLLTVLARSTGR